jgi:hypothetical protein
MSMGLAFWILMLVWVVFSGTQLARDGWAGMPATLLLVLLFGLLGWATFGAPIR